MQSRLGATARAPAGLDDTPARSPARSQVGELQRTHPARCVKSGKQQPCWRGVEPVGMLCEHMCEHGHQMVCYVVAEATWSLRLRKWQGSLAGGALSEKLKGGGALAGKAPAGREPTLASTSARLCTGSVRRFVTASTHGHRWPENVAAFA
ncbi:hypothetical protein AK812_SmicGene10698 [Symbiodinium microadriaticum]|uniref:Uncharacterized protein n=1 Tax=Symbiodinium microadriaticum TaxID=2951 RepID=A0A1Q9EF88_SYMMI|nr:hypothetical protein AK812_SmicGene10698 [Symbiodinium microadriaticum]